MRSGTGQCDSDSGLAELAAQALGTKVELVEPMPNRELLAIVTCVSQFKHYLLGRLFIVRTDHSALRWLMLCKDPCDQMARWLEILSQFNFKIVHRDGHKYLNADALSHVACNPADCLCGDRQTVLQDVPCAGCDQCVKMHHQWSYFWEIPLMTKRVTQGLTKEARQQNPKEDSSNRKQEKGSGSALRASTPYVCWACGLLFWLVTVFSFILHLGWSHVSCFVNHVVIKRRTSESFCVVFQALRLSKGKQKCAGVQTNVKTEHGRTLPVEGGGIPGGPGPPTNVEDLVVNFWTPDRQPPGGQHHDADAEKEEETTCIWSGDYPKVNIAQIQKSDSDLCKVIKQLSEPQLTSPLGTQSEVNTSEVTMDISEKRVNMSISDKRADPEEQESICLTTDTDQLAVTPKTTNRALDTCATHDDEAVVATRNRSGVKVPQEES